MRRPACISTIDRWPGLLLSHLDERRLARTWARVDHPGSTRSSGPCNGPWNGPCDKPADVRHSSPCGAHGRVFRPMSAYYPPPTIPNFNKLAPRHVRFTLFKLLTGNATPLAATSS